LIFVKERVSGGAQNAPRSNTSTADGTPEVDRVATASAGDRVKMGGRSVKRLRNVVFLRGPDDTARASRGSSKLNEGRAPSRPCAVVSKGIDSN
jgi:hypothetical protein